MVVVVVAGVMVFNMKARACTRAASRCSFPICYCCFFCLLSRKIPERPPKLVGHVISTTLTICLKYIRFFFFYLWFSFVEHERIFFFRLSLFPVRTGVVHCCGVCAHMCVCNMCSDVLRLVLYARLCVFGCCVYGMSLPSSLAEEGRYRQSLGHGFLRFSRRPPETMIEGKDKANCR